MHAVNVLSDPDPVASQAARSATEEASGSPPPIPIGSDSEVVPRARRRTLSNGDERRILQAADLCIRPGEVGAPVRREGVYSSLLSTWRLPRASTYCRGLAHPRARQAGRQGRQGAARDRGPRQSYRAAASAGEPGQGREHPMATMQEPTPALDAAFQANSGQIKDRQLQLTQMPAAA